MIIPSAIPVIETSRIKLRLLSVEDTDFIHEIYKDLKVAKYDDFEPINSREEAYRIISDYAEEFSKKSQIRWGIEQKHSQNMVGTCGLYDFDEDNNKCTIGYDLIPSRWNKGIMTNVVKAVTEFAYNKMDMHRIEAFITPGNDASIRVLKKNGYKEEGILREMEYFKGKYQDGIVVAIIKSDFKYFNQR